MAGNHSKEIVAGFPEFDNGNLSSYDGNNNENITWNCTVILFVLLCDYFNLFKFYRMATTQESNW